LRKAKQNLAFKNIMYTDVTLFVVTHTDK